MQRFELLRQPLMGELAMSPERKREEKKIPFIVANYVYASSQGQRTHSARTKMREIECNVVKFLGQGFKEDEQHIWYQALPYVPGTRCSLTTFVGIWIFNLSKIWIVGTCM